jgi:hypothetical protein
MSDQEQKESGPNEDELWNRLVAHAKEKGAIVTREPGVLTGWWIHVRHDGNEKEGYRGGHSFRGETLANTVASASIYVMGL